ncbi:MAG: STAS domain-containing protein [Anaerolineae bacterium]|nr:STAS domain-containing protein [Anaerolineae bacterium]
MTKSDRAFYLLALASGILTLIGGIGIGSLVKLEQTWALILSLVIGITTIAISILLWRSSQRLRRDSRRLAALNAQLVKANQTQERLQNELTAQQSASAQLAAQLDILSAPVIPIRQGVVVVPLVGALDAPQVQRIGEVLLHSIEQHRAQVSIIDLTGITGLSTETVPPLARMLSAIELMGCRTVLTGLSTDIVRELLEQKLDLHTQARRNLEAGIAYANSLFD